MGHHEAIRDGLFLFSKTMDHGRIVRLLNLMKLLSSNVDYTIQELSDRIGISRRSIFRYLDSFRIAGFAIHKRNPSIHKLLKMPVRGIPLEELVHLSEEEAHILHNLLGALCSNSQVIINLENKLSTLFNATSVTEIIGKPGVGENIYHLRQAMDEKKQVVLVNYESGHTMSISDRLVEPIKFSTNYSDVYAYEVSTGMTKIFKISRIESVNITPSDWQFEQSHENIETDCFRMTGKEDIPVTLKMTLKAKNLLIEDYPLSSKYISYDGESWWFKGNVKDLAGVGRFVIGLADQIEIKENERFIEYVQDFVDKYL